MHCTWHRTTLARESARRSNRSAVFPRQRSRQFASAGKARPKAGRPRYLVRSIEHDVRMVVANAGEELPVAADIDQVLEVKAIIGLVEGRIEIEIHVRDRRGRIP